MRTTLRLFKSSSSNRWLQRQANDPFVRGRSEGGGGLPTLRARSGFKLAELAKKYRNLLHGRAVVDLGAAPGGWTQVAAAAVARRGGAVVAVDILPMEEIRHAFVVEGDFFDEQVQSQVRRHLEGMRKDQVKIDKNEGEEAGEGSTAVADTVLSDMMAPMSGVRVRDVQASLDLVAAATEFAHQVLRPADPGAVLDDGKPKKKKKGDKDKTDADAEVERAADKENDKDGPGSKLYPGGSLV